MKKITRLQFVIFASIGLLFSSCAKTDDLRQALKDDKIPNVTKSSETTIKFAASGKSCGITDGYANQQHILPELVHLNTDKCHGETFRPTLTLNFGEALAVGTYEVVEGKPSGKQVKIESVQYNYTNWTGTKGTVVVSKNTTDATKLDIELKSISMRNDNAANDTKNPASDVLTGFIIKI